MPNDEAMDRSLFHNNTFVMLLINAANSEVVDANQAALAYYGYTHDEMVGMPVSQINTLHPEQIHHELQAASSERQRRFNFQHRLKNGEIRDVQSNTGLVTISGHTLLYSIVHDVTEQKRAEDELKLRSTALSAAANGVLITDANGTIQWANEAFTRMTGYTLDEIRGKNPRILQSGRNPEGLYRHLWKTITAGQVWRGELVNRRKNGSHYHEEQTVTPVTDKNGNIQHFIAIKQDISAAKLAQDEIGLRVRQQHAVAELGQLALQATPLDVLAQRAVTSLAAVLDVEFAAMLDLLPSKRTFIPRASVGLNPELIQHLQVPNDPTTLPGFTILSDQPVIIDDLQTETRFQGPALLTKHNVVSGMSVMIDNGDTPLGILSVHTSSKRAFTHNDAAFLQSMANVLAAAFRQRHFERSIKQANQQLVEAYDATIEGWAKTLDLRDHETEGHSRRVTQMSEDLAHSMGLRKHELQQIRRGALLHDIGKMGVPDAILLKPGPLTDDEWTLMKAHTTNAYNLLSNIPFLKDALDIPYCHHEKWDGSGYPRGLKGDCIPLAARIFAIVDVYDALTSDRPYRKAWTKQEALTHIRELTGSHFDPSVAQAFAALMANTNADHQQE